MIDQNRVEPSRRNALQVAGATGVIAVGVGTASACGSAETAVSSAASKVSAAASAAAEAIAIADIPVGGGKVFPALKVVVTQPTAGDYKAFVAVCPHQGCLVNRVADGQIVCPCHASTFDIATGAVTGGPATAPLAAKGVSVGADGITLT